jgi:hypothetical protein
MAKRSGSCIDSGPGSLFRKANIPFIFRGANKMYHNVTDYWGLKGE